MTDIKEIDKACSSISIGAGEQLFGTAPFTKTWILVEHPMPWGAKALEQSSLASEVKTYLHNSLTAIGGARFLFINPRPEQKYDGIRVFIAQSSTLDSKLYSGVFHSYEDLLEIPFVELAKGIVPDYFHQSEHNLYLVCTNGRRDPCCGRLGAPLYSAMSKSTNSRLYECTHVGGHRFAPNVITLPDGYYYGRVSPGNALKIIDAAERKEVFLPNLRGRSSYESHVQAAEYYVRAKSQITVINASKMVGSNQIDSDKYVVNFHSEMYEYTIIIRLITLQSFILESCHQIHDMVHPINYVLDDYQAKPI